MMTEIQHNELGYVYSLSEYDIEMLTSNSMSTSLKYYYGGFPFRDAEFIVYFRLDSNFNEIIENHSYVNNAGYTLMSTINQTEFQIIANQTIYPSFIEDSYFEPEKERYILILTV